MVVVRFADIYGIVVARSLFVLLSILFAIVLSVLLRFTDPDDPFGIFKFFLLIFIYLTYKDKN